MSTVGLIVVIVVIVLAVLVLTGLIASRRHMPTGTSDYAKHIAEADHALERARAADKGWEREALNEAAKTALAAERPGWPYEEVHLVLVDDAPGSDEDRAHLVATGDDGEARVILARRDDTWVLERLQ